MSTLKSVLQMALLVACLAVLTIHTAARSAEGFGRMGRLLESLKADSLGPMQNYGVEGAAHPLEKRQIYDASCKGIYNRAIFSELEHVCDDCYNLYRKASVASGCRENCFDNEIFDDCVVYDLLLSEDMLLMRDVIKG